MTRKEFEVLLEKYLNSAASPAERKLLDQFFDSYRVNPDGADISEEIKAEMFRNVQTAVDTYRSKNSGPGTIQIWIRAAAVISFFLVVSYFLFDSVVGPMDPKPLVVKMKEVSASKGQKLDIKLSDGSRIKLNANSKIQYPEKFSENSREVTLEGEAYFDVKHQPDRPFIVHTANASARVLGTSFNVMSIGEITEVTLVQGKVNVYVPNGDTVLLTPNRQAKAVNGTQHIDAMDVDVDKYIAWKDNTLHFDNISVREAFTILENWYNVKIEAKNPSLMNCIINSKYQNESLENVLNSFRFMLKIDFTINEQQVTVTGNGCSDEKKITP